MWNLHKERVSMCWVLVDWVALIVLVYFSPSSCSSVAVINSHMTVITELEWQSARRVAQSWHLLLLRTGAIGGPTRPLSPLLWLRGWQMIMQWRIYNNSIRVHSIQPATANTIREADRETDRVGGRAGGREGGRGWCTEQEANRPLPVVQWSVSMFLLARWSDCTTCDKMAWTCAHKTAEQWLSFGIAYANTVMDSLATFTMQTQVMVK